MRCAQPREAGSPRPCVLPAPRRTGRKEPAGLRALAGPPPASCSRGCHGGRGQGAGGSTGHQRMSHLKTSVRVRKPGAKKPAQNVSCSLQPMSTITWTARAPRGGWTPRLCRGSAKTVQWPLLACPHDTPLIPQSSRCHGGLPEQAASLCVYRSTSTEPGTTQKISEQCGRTFLKMPREGKPHETGSFPAF